MRAGLCRPFSTTCTILWNHARQETWGNRLAPPSTRQACKQQRKTSSHAWTTHITQTTEFLLFVRPICNHSTVWPYWCVFSRVYVSRMLQTPVHLQSLSRIDLTFQRDEGLWMVTPQQKSGFDIVNSISQIIHYRNNIRRQSFAMRLDIFPPCTVRNVGRLNWEVVSSNNAIAVVLVKGPFDFGMPFSSL